MENVAQKNDALEAIVLAGGMGTRLRAVVSDIPKPMAPISDRPFLSFILDDLASQGVQKVVLSTGYKHEVVEQYYQNQYKGMELAYSVEETPLGTGGAIRKALEQVRQENVFILNGDTLFRAGLQAMRSFHLQNEADMTIALKNMENCERYGIVDTLEGRVIRFGEKMANKSGTINGGIYLLNKSQFSRLQQLPDKFSFEKDFMESFYQDINMMAFTSDAYFIDIGIPEDYARAQHELLALS